MKSIILLFISTLLITACNINPPNFGEKTTSISTSGPEISTETPPVSKATQFQPVQAATCDDYQPQVERAVQNRDLAGLDSLLKELRRTDCSNNYLNGIKTQLSEMSAEKAKQLVKQGKVGQAEDWLKNYSPMTLWQTQEARGDVAAERQQWKQATEYYHHALQLIEEPDANPSKQDIHRVAKLAAETQMLSGELLFDPNQSTRGEDSSMKMEIRGVVISQHPIPIQFDFNQATFTQQGEQNAHKLAKYLEQERPNNIILVGHTDPEGGEQYNCELSQKRAEALKNYLINQGFHAGLITTLGKGESEPSEVYDPSRYSQDQLYQIYRRVEFAINTGIPQTHVCPETL